MINTYFAPPEKTEKRQLQNQFETIANTPLMTALLTVMAGLLVVLNEDRQIVALNQAFIESLGLKNPEEALGLRLGECIKCVHSHEPPAGCGTTPHCSTCGAVIAMMAAIREDRPDEQLCSVNIEQNGTIKDLCMMVRAQPLSIGDNRWILVFVHDITQQTFLLNLERVFFHDIRNVLGSLTSATEMLKLEYPENELVESILKSTYRLNDEIAIQSILASDKNVSHIFRKARSSMNEIRNDLELILSRHPLRGRREIVFLWPERDFLLNTVSLLVSRVIGNMMINAMEASGDGDLVRLSTKVSPDQIRFDIWNAHVIPEDIQLRIFQRHFSTKGGVGRGLGTYSMKIFGEKYLQGTVGFESTVDKGTTLSLILPR